jgi:phage-related protein
VVRKWTSFNSEITNSELSTIPQPHRAALYAAMSAYAQDLAVRYVVKSYGDGLKMVKASNGTAGRCLFFHESKSDSLICVAVLFYKKESDEIPQRLLSAAKARMNDYQSREN